MGSDSVENDRLPTYSCSQEVVAQTADLFESWHMDEPYTRERALADAALFLTLHNAVKETGFLHASGSVRTNTFAINIS